MRPGPGGQPTREHYPDSRFTGIDISAEAVDYARTEAETRGLRNVTFAVEDAATLAENMPAGAFNLVTTFDAVHDQATPDAVLRGIRHVLRDDGVYLAQDIDRPAPTRATSTTPGAAAVRVVAHALHDRLPGSRRRRLGTTWGRPLAQQYLRDADFGSVQAHTLPHDEQYAYYVCRP